MASDERWMDRHIGRREALKLGAMAAAGGLAAVLAACGGGSAAPAGSSTTAASPAGKPAAPGQPQPGGTLKLVFPTSEASDTPTLDPPMRILTYGNIITASLYDTLVYQDPKDNSIKPGLAESWTVSPDGKEFTFKLKRNAKFHDGTPFTAAAVKFTLDRAVDKKYVPNNAYTISIMADYDHTDVLDDHTAKVVLANPRANFLSSAVGRSYLSIVSPTAVQKDGVPGFGDRPIGCGPYRFVEWVKGSHITVERNPDYQWGSPIFHAGPAWVDRIEFRYIPEAATRVAALQSGDVNAIDGLPEASQSTVEKDSRFEVVQVRKNGSPGRFELNTQRFPTDDLAVRIAINQALDRDALVKTVFFGVGVPTYGLLEEKMLDFDPSAQVPHYDPAAAKKTLDDAGWTAGSDGIRVKDGKRLELVGLTYAENPPAMEFTQAQLKAVGMDLKVDKQSASAVTARSLGPGDFNLLYRNAWGWTNEDPHLLYSHFNTANMPPKGTSNEGRYSNPEIDKLTEQGLRELDPNKRKQIYFQVQQLLAKQAINVPLLSELRNLAVKKGVHGVNPDVRGTYLYLHDVWIEPSAR